MKRWSARAGRARLRADHAPSPPPEHVVQRHRLEPHGRGLEDATLAAYFDWGQPVSPPPSVFEAGKARASNHRRSPPRVRGRTPGLPRGASAGGGQEIVSKKSDGRAARLAGGTSNLAL